MTKRPTIAQMQDQFNMYRPKDRPLNWEPSFMQKTPRKASAAPRKTEEHDDQAAVVSYLHRVCPAVIVSAGLGGELRPTGNMGKFYGWMAKLKARGMLKGDADLRLTWFPSRCIFIEMKRKKGGVVSEAQEGVGARLKAQGFSVYILDNGIDGMREIIKKEKMPCSESL